MYFGAKVLYIASLMDLQLNQDAPSKLYFSSRIVFLSVQRVIKAVI